MKHSYLILTYSYTPMISARAFRWSMLAERWAAQGHDVDVVAGLEGDVLPYEQINGVNIYRVNNRIYQAIRRRSARTYALTRQAKTSVASPLRWITSVMRWVYYHLWVNVHWPDTVFLWYWPALKKAKQLVNQRRYDVLISVSPFFTAHMVGERISQQLSSFWLTDYGDPFSLQDIQPHNNIKLYGSLNHWIEDRILTRADAVSVTTQPTYAMYMKHFPQTVEKTRVIPPLLSITPASERKNPNSLPDNLIRMVFAGMFYLQTRPPDYLLKLFARLHQYHDLANRLELHLYGDISTVRASFDPYIDFIKRGKIVLHGTVSREVVTRAMEDAEILVNVGNKTAYQLPSKVIEYASLGKPILNLIQIEDDSSRAVYKSYPAALSLLDQGQALFEEQIQLLYQWVTHLPAHVDIDFLHEWLADYQIDAIAQAYDEIIGKPISRHLAED